MTNLHNPTSNGATITTRFGATFNPNFSFGYTFDDGWSNAMYEYIISGILYIRMCTNLLSVIPVSLSIQCV